MSLNRRSVILGGAAALCLGSASAPAQVRFVTKKRIDPVLFWNAVCLDLVALDHSVDLADARAPGPCASARALGLAHGVIADAVHFAYGCDYRPQFYRGDPYFQIEIPELFVGGAAAGILTAIFSTPAHAYTIGLSGERFKQRLGVADGKDWQAGIAFANSIHFRRLWNWDSMQRALLPQHSKYVPQPRGHSIDPNNASQGFYGSEWGSYPPLVLDGPRHVVALSPGAPPPEGSPEYERDLAEVRVKGALRSRSDRYFPARTRHETNIGLFWAYDGARLLGTPPRLYNQIIRQIAISDGFNVVETARLFALCNLAMADAANVAWEAKYRYNVWRPVLGIQNHGRAPAPGWLPLGAPKTNPIGAAQAPASGARQTAQALMGGAASLSPDFEAEGRAQTWGQARRPSYGDAAFTPNFPAYPSGHATFGGACFAMLRLIRRERLKTRHNPDAIHEKFISDELNGTSQDAFTGNARPYYPVVYRSIGDMITDNDLSRIYLGVHWRFDCNRGSEAGARIASAVYNAAYGPLERI